MKKGGFRKAHGQSVYEEFEGRECKVRTRQDEDAEDQELQLILSV